MIGGILGIATTLGAYAGSAHLVRKTAAWGIKRVRDSVTRYARSAPSRVNSFLPQSVREGIHRSIIDQAGIERAELFYRTGAARAKEAISKRTTPHVYRNLSYIGRSAAEEFAYFPANYTMYRMHKAGATSPEEKEQTQSFRKWYMGVPMMTSIGVGAVMLNRPALKRTTTNIAKRVPERLKKIPKAAIRATWEGTRSALGAGAQLSETLAAVRLASNRTFENQTKLGVLASRGITSVAKELAENYRATPRVDSRGFYHNIVENLKVEVHRRDQVRASAASLFEHRTGGVGAPAAISRYQTKHNEITTDIVEKTLSAYKDTFARKAKTMNFMNRVLKFAYGDGAPQIRRETVQIDAVRDLGARTGGAFEVPKGPGKYLLGDKQLDLGHLTLANTKDFLIRRSTSGIPGFFTGLFGVKDLLTNLSTERALGVAFRTPTTGQLNFPIPYRTQYGNPQEAVSKLIGLQQAAIDIPLSDGTRISRAQALTDTTRDAAVINKNLYKLTRGQQDELIEKSLLHGSLPVYKDSTLLTMPGGEARLITDLQVIEGNKRALIPDMVRVGGIDGGGYAKFMGATTSSNFVTRAIRSYMGFGQIHGTQVGFKPESRILSRGEFEEGGTLLSRIARTFDVGFSQSRPFASMLLNTAKKHKDPRHGPTLFSKEYIGSADWVNETAESLRSQQDLISTLTDMRDTASLDFWMNAKRRMGTKNIIDTFEKAKTKEKMHNISNYMIRPVSEVSMVDKTTIEQTMGKADSFMDLLRQMNKESGFDKYEREISHLQHFIDTSFRHGDNPFEVLTRSQAQFDIKVDGRKVHPSKIDTYNTMVLDVLSNESPHMLAKYRVDPDAIHSGMSNLMASPVLKDKHKSAIVASGHLSKFRHNLNNQFKRYSNKYKDLSGVAGNANEVKDIITSMTGKPDYQDIITYFKKTPRFASWKPTTVDYRLREDFTGANDLTLLPWLKPQGIIGLYKTSAGEYLPDMPIDTFNMSLMAGFHAFNRTASEMLGIGFEEATTRTPGQYMLKLATKRVIPGIALFLGYSAIDRMAEYTLDGTPFGEGLTVFGANIMAGARLSAQAILDTTGVTSAAKYMEDLLPGAIQSPLSGLARGFGPAFAGTAMGFKVGGPTGAITGGAVGAGVGMLLGGGPLGLFGKWDINKSRSELIAELRGEKDVAVKKGRWWELSTTPFEGTRIEYFRPTYYHMLRSDYKRTPQYKDSMVTEMIGSLAPDYYGLKHYYSRPYPITAGLFSNIPVFSEMIHSVPFSGPLLGAGYKMHEYEDYVAPEMMGTRGVTGEGTSIMPPGGSGRLASDVYDTNIQPEGPPSYADRHYGMPDPVPMSDTSFALGKSATTMEYVLGLRGFYLGTGFTEMTGQQHFFDTPMRYGSPRDIPSYTREYYDMNLGGLMGASEIIRRYMPRDRTQIEVFNPIRNTMPSYLPGEDYMIDLRTGDPYCISPETLVETGALQFEEALNIKESDIITSHKGSLLPVTTTKVRKLEQGEKAYSLDIASLTAVDSIYSEEHPLLICTNPTQRRNYNQHIRVKMYEHCNRILEAISKGYKYQKDIARYLNLDPSYVSNLCKILKKDNKIKASRRQPIEVIDENIYDTYIMKAGCRWKPVKDIKVGDYIAYPIPKYDIYTTIDLSEILNYPYTNNWIYISGTCSQQFPEIYEFLHNRKSISFERGELKQLIIDTGWNRKTIENAQRSIRDNQIPERIPRILNIDDKDIGYLMGLYIAGGYINEATVSFALHKDEESMFNRAVKGASKIIGYTPNHSFKPSLCNNGATGTIYSKAISLILYHYFGKLSHEKTIRDPVSEWPDTTISGIVKGYIDGDGCSFIDNSEGYSNNGKYIISTSTCNLKLALQLRKLLLRFGIIGSIVKKPPSQTKSIINNKEINTGLNYAIVFRGTTAHKLADIIGYTPSIPAPKMTTSWYFTTDDYIFMRINSIKEVDTIDEVIGFTIDGDKSFCTAGVATHNTQIQEGEARLPGPGYETIRNVDMVFPIEASMMGLSKKDQIAHWLGKPDFMHYKNNAEVVAEQAAKEIVEKAEMMGELTQARSTVYNVQYDLQATADAIIQGTPVRVVPQGFAGESDLNTFLVLADIEAGILYEINPDSGNVTEKLVQRDMNRFTRDLDRVIQIRRVAELEYHKSEREGKAINMANAYSWFDRFRILADVGQWSEEFRVAKGVVQQQLQTGMLSPNRTAEYYQILQQVEEKSKAFDFHEYRFMNYGDKITEEGKKMDMYLRQHYSGGERAVGAGWEYISHLRTPFHTKFHNQRSALEAYELETVFGKQIKMWQNPVEDYMKSYLYTMMNEPDPIQGWISGAIGGMILGGSSAAVAAGTIASMVSTGRALSGDVHIPERTRERREVMDQMDAVKYAKFKKLYQDTGDRRYLMQANSTLTGATTNNIPLETSSIGRMLGDPDKKYVEDIIRNMTGSDLKRATQVLPEPAVGALYNELYGAGTGNPQATAFANRQGVRLLPHEDSSIYREEVPVEMPAIRTMQMRGLSTHDAGMGWYNQMSSMDRLTRMGIYEGEDLYGTGDRQSVKQFTADFDEVSKIRRIVDRYTTNSTIMNTGSDSIEVEIIYR